MPGMGGYETAIYPQKSWLVCLACGQCLGIWIWGEYPPVTEQIKVAHCAQTFCANNVAYAEDVFSFQELRILVCSKQNVPMGPTLINVGTQYLMTTFHTCCTIRC